MERCPICYTRIGDINEDSCRRCGASIKTLVTINNQADNYLSLSIGLLLHGKVDSSIDAVNLANSNCHSEFGKIMHLFLIKYLG